MNNLALIMAPDDRVALKRAHDCLEYPSLAARLTNAIGTPLERGLKRLPDDWVKRINNATESTIRNILETSIASLGEHPKAKPRSGLHKILASGAGAIGGFFGLPALLIELPVTTAIMLRAIADIAHREGEDLRAEETRFACLEVFALGGPTKKDDATETGYYGLRLALGLQLSKAAGKMSQDSIRSGAPAATAAIRSIASRFGYAVSEKAALQMMPYLGAISGATVNVIFMQHFQTVAQGHFTVRRLERKYNRQLIREEYDKLSRQN